MNEKINELEKKHLECNSAKQQHDALPSDPEKGGVKYLP